jgi:hypothetical protein
VAEYCCMLGKNIVEFDSFDEYKELKSTPSGNGNSFERIMFLKSPRRKTTSHFIFSMIKNNYENLILLIKFLNLFCNKLHQYWMGVIGHTWNLHTTTATKATTGADHIPWCPQNFLGTNITKCQGSDQETSWP